jgi:hypothetical protein
VTALREFTVDEWSDLEQMLTGWQRTHEGASKAEVEAEAERLERMLRDQQECSSSRTLQLGIYLRCARQRRGHGVTHAVTQYLVDVRMTAEWDGEFEE